MKTDRRRSYSAVTTYICKTEMCLSKQADWKLLLRAGLDCSITSSVRSRIRLQKTMKLASNQRVYQKICIWSSLGLHFWGLILYSMSCFSFLWLSSNTRERSLWNRAAQSISFLMLTAGTLRKASKHHQRNCEAANIVTLILFTSFSCFS